MNQTHSTMDQDGMNHDLVTSKRVCAGKHPYHIEAMITFCGNDLVVTIGGGEIPHIGAVALAIPRPSHADHDQPSASVSVLCVTGHMEDGFARMAAMELAIKFECRVVIVAGIHVDDAESRDLKLLTQSYQEVLENAVLAIQETDRPKFQDYQEYLEQA